MQTKTNGTRTPSKTKGMSAQSKTRRRNFPRHGENTVDRPPWRTVLLLAGLTLCVAFFTWLSCLHMEKPAPRPTASSTPTVQKAPRAVVHPSAKADDRTSPRTPDTTTPPDTKQSMQTAQDRIPAQDPAFTPASEPLFTLPKVSAVTAPKTDPAATPAHEPTTMELRELEARLTSKARPFTVAAMDKARNGVARITQTADGLRIAASQQDGPSSVVLRGTVHLIDKNTFTVTGTLGLTRAGTALKPWNGRFVFNADAKMKGWRNDAARMLVWF